MTVDIIRAYSSTLNPVPSTPARTLNTNFTPNASRPTLCIYSVQISCTTTLLSGDDGIIDLRSDTAVTPTTVRCSMRNRLFQGLGVTVGTNSVVRSVLIYLVPAGHNVRLVTTTLVAAPVYSIVDQVEITL